MNSDPTYGNDGNDLSFFNEIINNINPIRCWRGACSYEGIIDLNSLRLTNNVLFKGKPMTSTIPNLLEKNPARVAGFMFIFIIVVYVTGMFIQGDFFVAGNAAETAKNIMASETLFRFALTLELIAGLCVIILAVSLYLLLKPINKNLALIALLWRVCETVIASMTMKGNFYALSLLSGADYLTVFETEQLYALMSLFFKAGSPGFYIATLVFSPASIIFWYLLLKSNYMPKFLAGFGVFASVVVSILCLIGLVLPHLSSMFSMGFLPIFIAELVGGFWLLIKGMNVKPSVEH